jgi:spore germination protein GerM
MSANRIAAFAVFAVVTVALAWPLFVGLPRWFGPQPADVSTSEPPSAPEEPSRRINAKLFYVAQNGVALVGVERDVPYADDALAQARAIIQAQLTPPESPLVSAVPAGTTLRALFLTARGEAFVDLSGDVVMAHSGGSVSELLTIYTIVHALTANMPAVTSVQILAEGREIGTLAGHVNLQRPLAPNPEWIQ